MSDKDSAQNVIESYRKRQSVAQRAPLIFGIAAILLIVGAAILIFWLTKPDGSPVSLFPPDTSTPTEAPTATKAPTATNPPADTPTLPPPTETPSPTLTATASLPFQYTVQEGDTLDGIAKKFSVDTPSILAINPQIKPPNYVIFVNQTILIPPPNLKPPTTTPLPDNLPPGTKIEYTVAAGDSLGSIATRFNSTVDAIFKENKDKYKLKTINDPLFIGWILVVPVNIVTPVPTATVGTIFPTAPTPATSTPTPQ